MNLDTTALAATASTIVAVSDAPASPEMTYLARGETANLRAQWAPELASVIADRQP